MADKETVEAIRTSIGITANKMEEALRVIQAWQIKKVAPVTLDQQDQRYQTDMTPQQRNQLRLDFIELVNEGISELTNARTLAGG